MRGNCQYYAGYVRTGKQQKAKTKKGRDAKQSPSLSQERQLSRTKVLRKKINRMKSVSTHDNEFNESETTDRQQATSKSQRSRYREPSSQRILDEVPRLSEQIIIGRSKGGGSKKSQSPNKHATRAKITTKASTKELSIQQPAKQKTSKDSKHIRSSKSKQIIEEEKPRPSRNRAQGIFNIDSSECINNESAPYTTSSCSIQTSFFRPRTHMVVKTVDITVSPVVRETREHQNQQIRPKLHLEAYTTDKYGQFVSDKKEQRLSLMLNSEQEVMSKKGFSTNLCSIKKYIGRIRSYLQPFSEKLLRRLNVKGKSSLERLQEIQKNSDSHENQQGNSIIPLYIFQEIEQLYQVILPDCQYQYFHDKCIFDSLNEKLQNQIRGKDIFVWDTRVKKPPQRNFPKIFKNLQSLVVKDVSTLHGLLVEKNDQKEKYEAEEWENLTRDYNIEIAVQLTDIIFEQLIEELEKVFDRFRY